MPSDAAAVRVEQHWEPTAAGHLADEITDAYRPLVEAARRARERFGAVAGCFGGRKIDWAEETALLDAALREVVGAK
jgi:hypothetical protein